MLGLHKLAATEEAVRAGAAEVTVVVVTSDVDELAPLARLTVAEWCGCLRQAAAAGVTAVGDDTEVALRIEGGRIVARAVGAGAFPVYSSSGR